jgi:hypothetical protein
MASASELSDALYNAIQFSKKAVAVLSFDGNLYLYGYDGFTFVTSKVEAKGHSEGTWFLPIDYAKALQKNLAATKSETVDLEFSVTDEGDLTFEEIEDLANMVDEVRKNERAGLPAKFGNVAFSPDRFRKLSLLKPSGLPIDLSFESDNGQAYAGFKYGPNTWGLLSFLDRSIVKEEMGSEYVW